MKAGIDLMLGDGKGKSYALKRPEEGTYIMKLDKIENGTGYFSVEDSKSNPSEFEAKIDEFNEEFKVDAKLGNLFKMVVQHVGTADYDMRIAPLKISNKGRYVSKEKMKRKLAYYKQKYGDI